MRSILLLPCLMAFAGFAFDIAAYYPGHLSFDSAVAWWQARAGDISDTQSPVLVYVWRGLELVWPGPGSVFTLHLVFFWGGLLSIALGLRLRPFASAVVLLLAGFAPIATILRSHIWTDVGLTGALLVLTGAIALFTRTARRGWLWLALAAGFYAMGMRHNALPALVPIVVYATYRFLERGNSRPARLSVGVGSGLVLAALFVAVQAVNAGTDRHLPAWPAVAVFDLGALSIATHQILLPDYVAGAGMDVADLKQAFRPWSANALLTGTRHGIRNPVDSGWTPEELAGLRRAWLAAIVANPSEYVAHRLEVSAALFGTHPREWPGEFKFIAASVHFGDNPTVVPNTSALHEWLMRTSGTLRDTPVFAAWPYLILGVLAAPIAWLRRDRPPATIALVLLASGAFYAVPLLVAAPSAELRYLLWPCVAALVALVLAFAQSESTPRVL